MGEREDSIMSEFDGIMDGLKIVIELDGGRCSDYPSCVSLYDENENLLWSDDFPEDVTVRQIATCYKSWLDTVEE